jgi:hypothetical protein
MPQRRSASVHDISPAGTDSTIPALSSTGIFVRRNLTITLTKPFSSAAI